MASIVMVIGQSGTGKSTSLRNFKKGECSVINVSRKPMPFKCEIPVANVGKYETIKELLLKTESPSIVIDDSTYLLVNEYMSKADERGYDKYTSMAKSFWDLMNFCINELPDWKIVYFLGHTEKGDDGREHFKTVGKMLDNTVVLEGYCTVVLKTVVEDGHYYFQTHNNGYDTVKSPLGMFTQDRIDNDLKATDAEIRKYFNLPTSKPAENKSNENKKSEKKGE
jgi:hypothetical protein